MKRASELNAQEVFVQFRRNFRRNFRIILAVEEILWRLSRFSKTIILIFVNFRCRVSLKFGLILKVEIFFKIG